MTKLFLFLLALLACLNGCSVAASVSEEKIPSAVLTPPENAVYVDYQVDSLSFGLPEDWTLESSETGAQVYSFGTDGICEMRKSEEASAVTASMDAEENMMAVASPEIDGRSCTLYAGEMNVDGGAKTARVLIIPDGDSCYVLKLFDSTSVPRIDTELQKIIDSLHFKD